MTQALHSDRTALAAVTIVLGPLLMSVGDLMHPPESMDPATQAAVIFECGPAVGVRGGVGSRVVEEIIGRLRVCSTWREERHERRRDHDAPRARLNLMDEHDHT